MSYKTLDLFIVAVAAGALGFIMASPGEPDMGQAVVAGMFGLVVAGVWAGWARLRRAAYDFVAWRKEKNGRA